MNRESIERGKLLYKEKRSQRLDGFLILPVAFMSSIIIFFIFYKLLTIIDDLYPNIGIMETYWWVLLFSLFIIPSVPYIHSVVLILKGKGPIAVYEKGIQMRVPYLSKKNKTKSFIFFDSIEKITLLYDGKDMNLFDMNLNELHISGIRIRTVNGEKFDLHSSFYAPYDCHFPYDIIQIMLKNLGDVFDKFFTLTPDIDEDEWENFLNSSKGFMNKLGEYNVKIALLGSMMAIPMFISMVLLFNDVFDEMIMYSIIFITTYLGFTTISFSTYFIFKHMERTQLELGALFRAQEYELIAGKKIIPRDLDIPEDYIYPGKGWPNFDKDFWDKIMEFREPKSRLDKLQYSGLYKKIIRETLIKIMRIEELSGKIIVPSYIRNLKEIGDLREWGEGNLDEISPKRRAKELKLKKRNDLYQALEDGHKVSVDLEFKPTCFRGYILEEYNNI